MTILGWMIYSVLVGLLLSSAAWLLDRGFVRLALATRWIWLAVMALTVALPFAAATWPEPKLVGDETAFIGDVLPVAAGSPSGALESAGTEPGWVQRALDALGRVFDPVSEALNSGLAAGTDAFAAAVPDASRFSRWIAALWALASFALALVLAWGPTRLHRLSRSWPEARAQGRRVRVSPDFGPAAIGVTKPEIVLPRWSLTLPSPDLSLVVDHEEAHVRARDPLLLAVGVAALVAMPWQPALWWQLRRLRDAVEVDCDRRVIRRQAGPALYGRILVELGAHGRMDVLLTPAVSGTRSLLARRLDAMRERSKRRELPRTFATSFVALALITVACNALPPTGPNAEYAPVDLVGSNGAGGSDGIPRPVPGGPGTDTATAVASASASSPEPEPSLGPVPSAGPDGISVVPPPRPVVPPVGIQGRASGSAVIRDSILWVEITTEDPPDQPWFTPYEVAPEVMNVQEVRQALNAEYPPDLRAAGIGGTVSLWFYITETGAVGNILVNDGSPSNSPELDAAALRVGPVFEFTPAMNQNRPVPVWISIPITFQPTP